MDLQKISVRVKSSLKFDHPEPAFYNSGNIHRFSCVSDDHLQQKNKWKMHKGPTFFSDRHQKNFVRGVRSEVWLSSQYIDSFVWLTTTTRKRWEEKKILSRVSGLKFDCPKPASCQLTNIYKFTCVSEDHPQQKQKWNMCRAGLLFDCLEPAFDHPSNKHRFTFVSDNHPQQK